MFTWICPQCGREVPPSYSECPTCAERKAGAGGRPPQYPPPPPQAPPQQPQQPYYAPAAPPQGAYSAPPPPQYAPPQPPPQPQYAPPPPQQYTPPPQPQYAPPPPAFASAPQEEHKGLPGWLMAVLAAVALVAVLGFLYKFVLNGDGGAPAPKAAKKSAETASAAENAYLKNLEVTGIRIIEEKGKPTVRFAVINHMEAQMTGVVISGDLIATSAKESDPPVGTFQAKIPSIDPLASKDVTVPVETHMRAYELPDWQFLKAKIQIIAPR